MKIKDKVITIDMPSQKVVLDVFINAETERIDIEIVYMHPTLEINRVIKRCPERRSFSRKHFEKELDAYIVQEAMRDLTDSRHSYDWID
jgi:hypothetical protein